MVKALFDTNIVIDFLNGVPQGREELDRYDEKAISIISWMEVLVGAPVDMQSETHAFLDTFAMIELDSTVAERSVELRKAYKMKLPDAIVWASADVHSMLLVTRNTKDFPGDHPGIRNPYSL